jgi:nucleoside-diphosphate-sugar epimerase
MRFFIAGATGTIGRPLVRALVARGHDVTGMTRTPARAALLESLGAHATVCDALDAQALKTAVQSAKPSHVVHLLTALPRAGALRAAGLRATNRLRIDGTANLLAASIAAGAQRLVGESFAAVYGAADFDAARNENLPLPPESGHAMAETVSALRSMEIQLQTERDDKTLETVALRYGMIYGPEVPSFLALIPQLQAGRAFLPRGAKGVASFVHVDDAVSAAVAALEHPAPSPVYNVADDEPVQFGAFLELLAATIGAPRPRSAPRWLVRLVAPVIAEMASARIPLSNETIKRELGWRPRYSSLTEGLREMAAELASRHTHSTSN